jgi:hypothetical protein
MRRLVKCDKTIKYTWNYSKITPMDNPTSSTYMEMFYSPIVEPSKIDELTTNYIWFIKIN